MKLTRDIVELEGLLELYDWIKNYDKEKVPAKKNLFLTVKEKLNLAIINKKNNLTPKSEINKRGKYRKSKDSNFSSEKCDRSNKNKINDNMNVLNMDGNHLDINMEKKLRPSTYCSIYPISTFSKIHNIIENRNIDINNLCIRPKNLDISKNFKERNEISELSYSNENTTETDYDYNDGKYFKYEEMSNKCKKKIDLRMLNNLLTYVENILRMKINSDNKIFENVNSYGKSNFCFLTLWKKIEEILEIKNQYELNDETIIWQQLRDVLLLTGMSLKYPTWSGEQLLNILTRIIPKRALSTIIKNKELLKNNSNDINIVTLNENSSNIYSGLINLYIIFHKHSDNIFDLITVSELVQENIKIYINDNKNRISTLNSELSETEEINNDIMTIKDEKENINDKLSNSNELNYNTSNEEDTYDGYVSLFEDDNADINEIDMKRRQELIDSLGLFINTNKVDKIIDNNNYSLKNSEITDKKSHSTKSSDYFDYNVFESAKNISKNIINLGISKKMIEEIMINNCTTENIQVEKKLLKDICDIIDDSISNSSIIVNYVNNNYTHVNNKNTYRIVKHICVIILLLISIIVFIINKNVIVDVFDSGKSVTIKTFRALTEEDSNYSLSKLYQNKIFNNHRDMNKSTDCILRKWGNFDLNDGNNSICDIIGDITVVEKCFTNINVIK